MRRSLSADTLIDESFACGMWRLWKYLWIFCFIILYFIYCFVKFVIGALLVPAVVFVVFNLCVYKIIYVN